MVTNFEFFNITRNKCFKKELKFNKLKEIDENKNIDIIIEIANAGQKKTKNYFIKNGKNHDFIINQNKIKINFFCNFFENNNKLNYYSKKLLKYFIKICNLKNKLFINEFELNLKNLELLPEDDIFVISSVFLLFIKLNFNIGFFSFCFQYLCLFLYYTLNIKYKNIGANKIKNKIIKKLEKENENNQFKNLKYIFYLTLKNIDVFKYFQEFVKYNNL